MQYLNGGPEIPEKLLQEHEDGHVVFFCGAGISYPAGLPSFQGLVTRLYQNYLPNPVQKKALDEKKYDIAVSLLESDIIGGREDVRIKIAEILRTASIDKNSLKTHEAILKLSKHSGKTRLITTNFDRLFFEVLKNNKLDEKHYKAPCLPVPKNIWHGIVYLHGVLADDPSQDDLETLVVSSGDFGLAYLTERWAARFVSELFRNFTVCFIGYSLDDPVMRYMMDALAADKQRGELTREMYAFCGYKNNDEKNVKMEWEAKNVIPILYHDIKNHMYLHKSLHLWANTYNDGVRGKELIIINEARANPLTTKNDDMITRVLWALSDKSGIPARIFSELDPAPSLEWLEVFMNKRYKKNDLFQFGVQYLNISNDDFCFSLLNRPTPSEYASWMAPFNQHEKYYCYDNVMEHIVSWMMKFLFDPLFIEWIVGNVNKSHYLFLKSIKKELDKYLNTIEFSAQSHYQRQVIIFWQMFFHDKVYFESQDNFYEWGRELKQYGWTQTSKMELRRLLSPKIKFRKSFRWNDETDEKELRLNDYLHWEIVLTGKDAKTFLKDKIYKPEYRYIIPDLIEDLSILITDAISLMKDIEQDSDYKDLSNLEYPSIVPHQQNKYARDWTILIDLIREAWGELKNNNPTSAYLIAQQWFNKPFLLFKRLAFYASTFIDIISPSIALSWLVSENAYWLWAYELKREIYGLLKVIGTHLSNAELLKLEKVILHGPAKRKYHENIPSDEWEEHVNYDIWIRLSKLKHNNVQLSSKTEKVLKIISNKHPRWHLPLDESDEFSVWMGGFREATFTDDISSFNQKQMEKWLLEHDQNEAFGNNNWIHACKNNYEITSKALIHLVENGTWIIERWKEALEVWINKEELSQSWEDTVHIFDQINDGNLLLLSRSVSLWLQALSSKISSHQELFIFLSKRIIILQINEEDKKEESINDNITIAINHTIGIITEGIKNYWLQKEQKDNKGIPLDIKEIFTLICDVNISVNKNGRIILARYCVLLFRVDSEWTINYLLPCFKWEKNKQEALMCWEGFLWSSRYYKPLYEIIKDDFLAAVNNYAKFGNLRYNYVYLFVHISLEVDSIFLSKDIKEVVSSLPEDGHEAIFDYFIDIMQKMTERRDEYIKNRMILFFDKYWHPSRKYLTQRLSEKVALLCIKSKELFPLVFKRFNKWLLPVESIASFLYTLEDDTNILENYPLLALEFLNLIINNNTVLTHELCNCLKIIARKDTSLLSNPEFTRIKILYESRNGHCAT